MSYRISRSRWYLKKAARNSLAATAWGRGALAVVRRVRALTYHHFGDSPRDPLFVPRRDFEAQMRWLAENELAVSLKDVEDFLAGENDLSRGALLVTVDDGFRSVYTDMLPVLQEYDIAAVAYVTPSFIGDRPERCEPTSPEDSSEPYLTWDELCALADAGVAIGSHGWTHRSFGPMGPAEARDEAARSREMLEKRLGRRVTSFAYPYGTRADFSHTTANILAEVGYTTAFTSQHGVITRNCDPIELPRIKVEGGESLWLFRRLCHGALDAWRLIDRILWPIQQQEDTLLSCAIKTCRPPTSQAPS